MSDDTLERLVQAAKAFKNDVTQLPGLRNALAAHDAEPGRRHRRLADGGDGP